MTARTRVTKITLSVRTFALSAALWLPLTALLPALALAEPPAAAKTKTTRSQPAGAPGEKVLSGMSIVGNDEAPRSLVIVPWKSSGLGDALDVSLSLEDGREPVDPQVFRRSLAYYEIRVGRR